MRPPLPRASALTTQRSRRAGFVRTLATLLAAIVVVTAAGFSAARLSVRAPVPFTAAPDPPLTTGTTIDMHRQFSPNASLGDVESVRFYTSGPYAWAWRVALPQSRLILYYGNPLSPVLGPIGRYSDSELVARLRAQAAVYQGLDPSHDVVPGFDYVTPVAQPDPQKNGTYTLRMPDDSIQHYIALAHQNRLLFFFDLQVGHSTVKNEVDALWKYVEQPGVNIALDPEFDMAPGDIPGVEFGRMYAWEINAVIDRLSELVSSQDLPPKILIVHWFRPGLIPDWQNVHVKPGVSVITSDDGVGPPGPKIDDYNIYDRQDLIQYPGIKIFYNLDKPLMQPQDALALNPKPVMVMYQ